ncbi:MAG: S8 family serine peptidase [Thiohalobacteraceae bacterium]
MSLPTLRRVLRRQLLALFGIILCNGAAFATERPEPGSQLIVRLQSKPAEVGAGEARAASVREPEERFAAIEKALGLQDLVVERHLGEDVILLRFADATGSERRAEVTALLRAHPEVQRAEPDGRVYPAFVPNDPGLSSQWYLYEAYGIQAYNAWDLQRGLPGITVAVLDTGILDHQDLDPGRVLPGYDFVGGDADPTDPGTYTVAGDCEPGSLAKDSTWHGLHLAGIVAAAADNGVGVAGINHASPLLPVRVLGKCGGLYSDIIAGVRWAAGVAVPGVPSNPRPARVINLSFSAPERCDPEIQRAINDATAAGAIVVAAAGNGNGSDISNVLPAGCDNVIAIAATDRIGTLASYSNVGSQLALGAPGTQIYALYNSGATVAGADSYASLSGTSVAAAQVSAAVSLLLSTQPAFTLNNIRAILQQSARPYTGGCPSVQGCGAGILDLRAALRLAAITTPGDPASNRDGGGGGGGCVLAPDAPAQNGVAWLLLGLWLVLLRLRSHSGRV